MRDLVLLLFVVGTLPMALMRPIIGLLLWMMFSYLNPHRMTWGFASAFPWVMIVALVTLTGLAMQVKQRQAPPVKSLTVLMTLFLIWVAASTSQAVLPDQALTKLIEFMKMMTMVYVTLMLVTDRQKLQWAIWVIVASFAFWGAKGGLFTALTGGSYHVMGPTSSFFTDNNAFALIMCMIVPLVRYVQLCTDRRWLRIGLWGVLGLMALSIIGTYSRGGLLALGLTAVMLIWKSSRRSALILIVPVLAVSLLAFMPQKYIQRISSITSYQQDASATGRIQSWKFATNKAMANPLFGGGFRVWNSQRQWQIYGPPDAHYRAIHSIFFEVLGEQGFVGLALFMAMLAAGYLGLARVRKQARAGPDETRIADLASMMQVSLVAYTAAGALLPLPYIDLLYQLLALVVVMQTLTARSAVHEQAGKRVKQRPTQAVLATAGANKQPEAALRRKSRLRQDRGKRRTGAPGKAGGAGDIGGAQDLPPW